MIAYLQEDSRILLSCNSDLNQEDLAKLWNLLSTYLEFKTEAQHFNRISLAIKVLEETEKSKKKLFKQKLSELLLQRRCYDPKQQPAFLVFECLSNKRLRENQVQTIESLMFSNGVPPKDQIRSLGMGDGKTKILLPLLCYLNSTGENLPMIIVPEELFETNLYDLKLLSSSYLSQSTYTLILNDQSLSNEDLEDILKKFQTVKNERSYCITTPKSLHHIKLEFVQSFLNLNGNEDQLKRFQLLKMILIQLKTQGDAVIDEADLILDCLKEVNASIGKPQSVSPHVQKALARFFEEILKHPVLSIFFRIDEDADLQIDRNQYKEIIVPILSSITIQLIDECNELESLDQAEADHYLKGEKVSSGFINSLNDLSKETRDILSLGKESIQIFFPLIFTKNANEHFGLSHVEEILFCIPYARVNTPWEGSQFGNHYETMMYTMIYYTRKGLKFSHLKSWINQLKQEAVREAKMLADYESMPLDIQQSPTYQFFKEWNPCKNIDLFEFTDSAIADLQKIVNQSTQKRMTFVTDVAWKAIEINSEKISSNAQDLVSLFRSTIGFTGTPYNHAAYPSKIHTYYDSITDGKTLELLVDQKPKMMSSQNVMETLANVIYRYDAFIDSGAFFRGEMNLEVAKQLLIHLPPRKKGVVFYNDVDMPKDTVGLEMILERGEDTPKRLIDSNVPEEKRFTYYSVATGADISQVPFAGALASIGAKTTFRDLSQAIWRMREIDREQYVDFIAHEGIVNNQILDLLTHCINNQSHKLEEDIFRSFKQKMKHLITNLCIKLILDIDENNIEDQLNLIQHIRKHLVDNVSIDPYDAFGKPTIEVEMNKIVKKYKKLAIKQYSELLNNHPRVGDIYPKNKFLKDLKLLVQDSQLPKKGKDTTQKFLSTREQIKTNRCNTKTQINSVYDRVQIDHNDCYSNNINFDHHFFSLPSASNEDSIPQISFAKYLEKFKEHKGELFDSEIFLSTNFASTVNSFSVCAPEAAFGKDFLRHGPCLCKFDKKSNDCSLTILDPIEGEFVYQTLDKDRNYNTQTKQGETYFQEIVSPHGDHNPAYFQEKFHLADVILWNPEIGIISSSRNADIEKFLNHPKLLKLQVQAKFIQGYLSYTKQEQEALCNWINSLDDPEELESFFLNKILRQRPIQQKNYEGSILARIFHQLKSIPKSFV